MFKYSLEKWEDIKSIDSLLYFSQLSFELLSENSFEKYKLSTLNTKLLCKEILDVIEGVEKDTIVFGALLPLFEEFKHSLNEDFIVKEIIGEKTYTYYKNIKYDAMSTNEIKHLMDKIVTELEENNLYFEVTKRFLKLAVIESKSKKYIEKVTKIFYIELINLGYSKEYISYVIENFFFSGNRPEKINSITQINNFIDSFTLVLRDFEVVFKEDKSSYIGFQNNFQNIKIMDEINVKVKSNYVVKFISSKKEDEVFLVQQIKAYDYHSARNIAAEKIEYLSNIYSYFFHAKFLNKIADVLIISVKENKSFVILSNNQNHDTDDNIDHSNMQNKIYNIMNQLTENKLANNDTRFKRALEMHAMANNSQYLENKFLDYWSILEILFLKNERDKIRRLCKVVVPHICNGYIEKMFEDLYATLLDYNPNIEQIIAKHNFGDTNIKKLANIIFQNKNCDNYNKILKEIDNYPLLENKVKMFGAIFSTPKKIIEFINRHENKIEWHIKRMYRTRNFLLHDGKIVFNLHLLVENLHEYVDVVIDKMKYYIFNENVTKLENINIEMNILYKEYRCFLQNMEFSNRKITNKNYIEFLFGDVE